jgi:hypothetical protein
LYPVQNSVGSLTAFSANKGLEEAAIAYDTSSESGDGTGVSWSSAILTTVFRLFFAGCP